MVLFMTQMSRVNMVQTQVSRVNIDSQITVQNNHMVSGESTSRVNMVQTQNE